MCGILAILREDNLNHKTLETLKVFNDSRGPDYSSPLWEHYTKCGLKLKIQASVLHLRGEVMQEQPVIDEYGNVLMFNGQIYQFANNILDTKESDTSYLVNKLKYCRSHIDIAKTFSRIDGPFAFIYWSNELNSLFFGRDVFGRKSLCSLQGHAVYPYVISSVAVKASQKVKPDNLHWTEVDCKGFFCLDFTSIEAPNQSRYMWNLDLVYPTTSKCESIPESGNITYKLLPTNHLLPLNSNLKLPIEFNDRDRKVALVGLEEKLIESVAKRIKFNRTKCLSCRQSSDNCEFRKCDHTKVAVAFSGGIDSTLIALALDKVYDKTETIDLITVAFQDQSPDRISVGMAFKEIRKLSPGRNWRLVLCDITVSELQTQRKLVIRDLIFPCNTVVDDSLGCACWFISRALGRSIDSNIDDSHFNSIFDNFINYNPPFCEGESAMTKSHYQSPASMLFTGSSIDEQLGGYSSHRAAWHRSGNRGLLEEISFQMRRLSTRNLGRDDRILSHHGRDVKLPYLDYELVSYLNQLPVGLKMNFDGPQEIGPKRLLRELAQHWGLIDTSRRVKRALQFGSRIANLECSKEKGNDICARLN